MLTPLCSVDSSSCTLRQGQPAGSFSSVQNGLLKLIAYLLVPSCALSLSPRVHRIFLQQRIYAAFCDLQLDAEARLRSANEAYEVLSDTAQRAEYDVRLKFSQVRLL
jgi:hypothetical protein